MATFRNYEPRSEGLNAAYDLLLRAELAKAQAMGGAFAPLTDAIRSGQQMKIARDEQARLKQAQAEDSALRTQRMGLDTRELDLREKTLNRQMSQDDAFTRALSAVYAPEQMQPAASGTPFQGGSAAMTQRTPLSAGGLLGGGGGGQIDPSMLGAMGGENASRYLSMHNTMHDNALQDQKYADEQRQKQQVEQAFNSNLAAGVAGKVKGVYEDKGAGIRARFAVDPKAASEELAKAQDAHLDRVGMQRKVKNDVKELRAAILQTDAESELKNRLLDGLELQVKSLEDIDPEIIKKNLEDARSYVYGTDTQSRSQRKSEADKQAEADAKSPFKYLAGDKEFKQGGWIGAASRPLQAKVELEATMKAAELGRLRNDALILAASSPKYEEIVAFQDKMTAAEKEAIQGFKKMIWESGGWTAEVPGGPLPTGASPREGLPFDAGTQPSILEAQKQQPSTSAGPRVDPNIQDKRGLPPEYQKKLESESGRRQMVMDGSVDALGYDVEFKTRQEMDTFIKTGVLPQRYWK